VIPLYSLLLTSALGAPGEAAASYRLVDAGHDLDAPVALVVITPGMQASSFQALAASLESDGLDAWTVQLLPSTPLPDQGADSFVAQVILPAAVTELRLRDPKADTLALVGHGPGGTLALMSAAKVAPAAVAVLGPILGPVRTAAMDWMREQPLPAGNVDLSQPVSWQGHDLAGLLLGEPTPPLQPLATPLAAAFLGWAERGPPLDPAAVECPVWIGAGAMDRLVPVESLHAPSALFSQRRFLRFGLLRLDPADPGSADMLRDDRYHRPLAQWLVKQVS